MTELLGSLPMSLTHSFKSAGHTTPFLVARCTSSAGSFLALSSVLASWGWVPEGRQWPGRKVLGRNGRSQRASGNAPAISGGTAIRSATTPDSWCQSPTNPAIDHTPPRLQRNQSS